MAIYMPSSWSDQPNPSKGLLCSIDVAERTQIAVPHEQEAYAGRLFEATETVRSVRVLLADVDVLLSGDTSYLPYGTLRETSDLLAGLDDRITAIERCMRPATIH